MQNDGWPMFQPVTGHPWQAQHLMLPGVLLEAGHALLPRLSHGQQVDVICQEVACRLFQPNFALNLAQSSREVLNCAEARGLLAMPKAMPRALGAVGLSALGAWTAFTAPRPGGPPRTSAVAGAGAAGAGAVGAAPSALAAPRLAGAVGALAVGCSVRASRRKLRAEPDQPQPGKEPEIDPRRADPPNTMPPVRMPMVDTGSGEKIDVMSKLLQDRIIILGGEVKDEMAQVLVAQMLYLANTDPDSDITMYINSPGGSVSAGMAA